MKKLNIFLVVIMLMISFTQATAQEFLISPESPLIFVSYGSAGIGLSAGLIVSSSFSRLDSTHFQHTNMEL